MTILIKILQFVMSLSILVIIHELGHFTLAKLFKTRVEKFYLFFDPWLSLFKYKKGETEYGIGWLPLGGYVKISGMIDESMDKEQMKLPPQPWEFRSKTSWQRLLIMTGGVIFNFIFAMLIFIFVLFAWGETYLPTANVKYGIVTDTVGYGIGLKNGDKILTIDNQHIENFHEITSDIILNNRKTIQVERDGSVMNIEIPKEYVPKMLKGKGQIDSRIPFGPYVVESFGKKSPGKTAGILINNNFMGPKKRNFVFYDNFKNFFFKNKDHLEFFIFFGKKKKINFS